jgi:hypothetical protein
MRYQGRRERSVQDQSDVCYVGRISVHVISVDIKTLPVSARLENLNSFPHKVSRGAGVSINPGKKKPVKNAELLAELLGIGLCVRLNDWAMQFLSFSFQK